MEPGEGIRVLWRVGPQLSRTWPVGRVVVYQGHCRKLDSLGDCVQCYELRLDMGLYGFVGNGL